MNARKHVSIFVDESGRGRPDNRHNPEQPYFLVGVLVTDHAPELSAIIDSVCDEENFRRELHWRIFNRTACRVYVRVAERLQMEPSWEFKATVFELDNLDFTFFGGTENRAPIEREHTAYNYFVKTAIEAALRYSSLISEATDIEIIIDEKTRTANDNFSHYLERTFKRNYPDANIIIRDCPSEDERLIQACDIMSGARNTILVKMAGLTKQTAAVRVWLPRCKSYLFPLKPKK